MRFTIVTMALLLLVTGGLFINEGSTNDGQGPFTAAIDPLLTEALEEAGQVKVWIAVRNLPIPGSTWSVDARARDATERQVRIPSVLDENDFTLPYQSESAGVLSGSITESGVEKLSHHPFVLAIDMTIDVDIDSPLISTD